MSVLSVMIECVVMLGDSYLCPSACLVVAANLGHSSYVTGSAKALHICIFYIASQK